MQRYLEKYATERSKAKVSAQASLGWESVHIFVKTTVISVGISIPRYNVCSKNAYSMFMASFFSSSHS